MGVGFDIPEFLPGGQAVDIDVLSHTCEVNRYGIRRPFRVNGGKGTCLRPFQKSLDLLRRELMGFHSKLHSFLLSRHLLFFPSFRILTLDWF